MNFKKKTLKKKLRKLKLLLLKFKKGFFFGLQSMLNTYITPKNKAKK